MVIPDIDFDAEGNIDFVNAAMTLAGRLSLDSLVTFYELLKNVESDELTFVDLKAFGDSEGGETKSIIDRVLDMPERGKWAVSLLVSLFSIALSLSIFAWQSSREPPKSILSDQSVQRIVEQLHDSRQPSTVAPQRVSEDGKAFGTESTRWRPQPPKRSKIRGGRRRPRTGSTKGPKRQKKRTQG